MEKKHWKFKTKMKNYLKNLIEIIKTGSPADVKLAQKQVEKFWHDYYIEHRQEGQLAFEVFLEELKTFEQIKDIDHQSYFINVLKWPLWAIGEEHFEEWADFLLANVQHPSGKIRQAVVRATEYLIHDLRLDLEYDFEIIRSQGLKFEECKKIVENNKARFGNFVMTVEDLIDRSFEPRFKKYKYISSLPIGVYKSLNNLMAEALLPGDYQKSLYQDFLNGLRAKRKGLEPPKVSQVEILRKKRVAEEEVGDLIELMGCGLSLEEIKDIVYNEDGNESMRKIILSFDQGQDIDEMNRILQIISNAWNYWPHKKLNGLSPAEKLAEND